MLLSCQGDNLPYYNHYFVIPWIKGLNFWVAQLRKLKVDFVLTPGSEGPLKPHKPATLTEMCRPFNSKAAREFHSDPRITDAVRVPLNHRVKIFLWMIVPKPMMCTQMNAKQSVQDGCNTRRQMVFCFIAQDKWHHNSFYGTSCY